MSLHPLVAHLSSININLPPPLIASSLLKVLDSKSLTFFFTLLTTKINIGNIQNTKQNAEILKVLKNLKILERDGKFLKLVSGVENSICIKEWNKWIGDEINTCNGIQSELLCNTSVAVKGATQTGIDLNTHKTHPGSADQRSFKSFERFEDILNLIVNRKGNFECKQVRQVLLKAEIINYHLEITNKGFEFLLKSRTSQLWELLFTVLKMCEFDQNEMIEILLELSLLKEGTYLVKRMAHDFYNYLEKLGLIDTFAVDYKENECMQFVKGFDYEQYLTLKNTEDQKKGDNSHFYKKLMKNEELVDSSSVSMADNVQKKNNDQRIDGNKKTALRINYLFKLLFAQEEQIKLDFLIVESNFRLYLKTSLLYHQSILALFTQTIHNLPNFIVSIISEESLGRAFDKGITGEQIYKYLKSITQEMPDNVTEQIFIWQEKRTRMIMNECVMFSGFLSITDFRRTVEFCKNRVDYNEEKRMLFVRNEDVELVKKFIVDHKM